MNKSKLLWTTLGVVLVAGLIWLIASAPKSQAPQSPAEVAPSAATPPAPGGNVPAPAPSPAPQPGAAAPNTGTSKNISLFLVAPLGGEKWLIGENHSISWTSSAQITGEVTLIQAETKKVVGWINSTTGANQTSFEWDTHYVSLTRNGANRAEVTPGNYLVQVKFDSASYPVLTSGQISLVTVAQPIQGRTVSIQSFAFSPGSTVVARGGKVVFTNNDGVPHNITFQSNVYPVSPLAPGESVTVDTSVFPPGTYNYYCSIHPSMKGTLTVQ